MPPHTVVVQVRIEPDAPPARCLELHLRRYGRVVWREVQIKDEAAGAVRGVLGARDDGAPQRHVVLVGTHKHR